MMNSIAIDKHINVKIPFWKKSFLAELNDGHTFSSEPI